jgi:hypothetical protein
MTGDNKQTPSQQQQQQQQQAPSQQQQTLVQALGFNLPGMLTGQNPFCFSQRNTEEQRAYLMSTILKQALELTDDCDDFFLEEEEENSLTDHGEDDGRNRNRQKQ